MNSIAAGTGAFDDEAAITDLSRRLAQLPLDPRLGRMILQADSEGCVRRSWFAALTIPDPRRPSREGKRPPGRSACALRRRELGLRVFPQPVAIPERTAEIAVRQRIPTPIVP